MMPTPTKIRPKVDPARGLHYPCELRPDLLAIVVDSDGQEHRVIGSIACFTTGFGIRAECLHHIGDGTILALFTAEDGTPLELVVQAPPACAWDRPPACA